MDDVRAYFHDERRRVRRIGLGLVAVIVIIVAAYAASQVFSEKSNGAPAVDNTTGNYVGKGFDWPLCAVFVLLGSILLYALVLEANA